MTAAEVATPSVARARVDRIKTGVEVIWQLVVESYESRDWQALGYSTWDEMCTREFGTSRLRLPREERAETVHSLRDAGLSLRAIAAATGESKDTVARALAGVSNETPATPPTGTRSPSTPAPPQVDRSTGEVSDVGTVLAAGAAEVVSNAPREDVRTLPPVKGIDGKTYKPTQPKPAEVTPANAMRQARAEYKASAWNVFNEKLADIDRLTEWLRIDEVGGPAGVVKSMHEMTIPGDVLADAQQVLSQIGRAERTLSALREAFNTVGGGKLRSVR